MKNNKIILLDGGMGQELLRRTGAEPTPAWSARFLLDAPEVVEEIHYDFIQSGSSAITINAYSATPERLNRDLDVSYFEDLQALSQSLAKSARERSGKSVTITGCLPPLFASYRPDVAPSFDECLKTYRRIVDVQKDNVDVFLCETMASIKEATAALQAGKESGKPVWVALTVLDEDGVKLRSGEDLSEAVSILENQNADAILINCSSPEAISQSMEVLKSLSIPFGAYANGFTSIAALAPGGTVTELKRREDLTPDAYTDEVMKWINAGASIIGGCCEITPDHIKSIANTLELEGVEIVGSLS